MHYSPHWSRERMMSDNTTFLILFGALLYIMYLAFQPPVIEVRDCPTHPSKESNNER